MEQHNTKQCTACGRTLPLECFNRDITRPDGRKGVCRECRHLAYLERRDADFAALRRAATSDISDELTRRATLYDLLDRMPPADIAMYLALKGWTVIAPADEEGGSR